VRYSLSQPLDTRIQSVQGKVSFGAGTLLLDGKAPSGVLLAGELEYEDSPPRYSYVAMGDEAQFELQPDEPRSRVGRSGMSRRLDWDVHLSPGPVYRLKIAVGACRCRIDLSGLKVSSLDLGTGASDVEVTFGAGCPDCRATIAAGVARVTVRVPRWVGVRAKTAGALTSSSLGRGGLLAGASQWTSEGYDAKGSHLDLRVSTGVGRFDFEWID